MLQDRRLQATLTPRTVCPRRIYLTLRNKKDFIHERSQNKKRLNWKFGLPRHHLNQKTPRTLYELIQLLCDFCPKLIDFTSKHTRNVKYWVILYVSQKFSAVLQLHNTHNFPFSEAFGIEKVWGKCCNESFITEMNKGSLEEASAGKRPTRRNSSPQGSLVQFFCPNSCTLLSELSAIWHKHIMIPFIVKYTDMSVMPVVLWKAWALHTASSCSFSGTSAFNLTMQVQENGHNLLMCDMWIEGQVSSLSSMSIPAPVSVPMEQNHSVVWVGRHISRSSGVDLLKNTNKGKGNLIASLLFVVVFFTMRGGKILPHFT